MASEVEALVVRMAEENGDRDRRIQGALSNLGHSIGPQHHCSGSAAKM